MSHGSVSRPLFPGIRLFRYLRDTDICGHSNLMAPDEFKNLGFKDEEGVQQAGNGTQLDTGDKV